MAVWHYGITLLPRKGIVAHFGSIPLQISPYAACEALGVDEVEINLWTGCPPPEDLAETIGKILLKMESWSDEALMFGAREGHKIEIWLGDCIIARADLRSSHLELVRSLVDLAAEQDWMIIPKDHGRPLEPLLEIVLADIQSSRAHRFCQDPKGFLLSLKNEEAEV